MVETPFTTIYAVWARTDDFYDDGHLVSFHRAWHNASAEAARLKGEIIENVGTVMDTDVQEVQLRP